MVHSGLLPYRCVLPYTQIFELDEAKRIDIPGIRGHPWYNAPLAATYEDPLRELGALQETIKARMEAGMYAVRAGGWQWGSFLVVACVSCGVEAAGRGGWALYIWEHVKTDIAVLLIQSSNPWGTLTLTFECRACVGVGGAGCGAGARICVRGGKYKIVEVVALSARLGLVSSILHDARNRAWARG